MKQLTQSEIRKNGKVYKNVSSPATEGTMKQVTDIVEKDGTFSVSTDGGKTYSPASGATPEALPQEASALKSGELPTSGWSEGSYVTYWTGDNGASGANYYKKLFSDNNIYNDVINDIKLVATYSSYTTRLYNHGIKTVGKGTTSYPYITGYVFTGYETYDVNSAKLVIAENGDVYGTGSYSAGSDNWVSWSMVGKYEIKQQFYTISDTDITENSDVLMELTDEGGVKAYTRANGSITLIRDTVPTTAIPYTYKVKQTNASGQFTVINHYVPSGSGGGSANYTKIESTIPTSAWVSSAPSWVGQNALTWSANDGAYYIQGGTKDLGLVAGNSYTATLTIDGTDYDAENSEVMDSGGMPIYVGYFNNFQVMLQIFDHCSGVGDSGPISGNGYLVLVIPMGGTVPSSVIVKSFSAVGVISAIISNSAIKVNSAATMYIDYSGKISAAEKANGSITVSANAIPTVDIPYVIEISDTNTEGLFEVINSYVPEMPKIPTQQQADWEQTDDTAVDYIKNKPAIPKIPTIPTNLPQTAEGSTEQTWAKGETTIEVSDSSITSTSDIDIILSYEGEITGTWETGKFTLQANSALTKNVKFKYKIKQTSGYGQINIINNYRIPSGTYSANYLKGNVNVQTSAWVASSTYSQYPYQAEISITDLDWLKKRLPVKPVESIGKITADVVFDVADALSGIFAPVCSVVKPASDDEDVKVIIYASEKPISTIGSIVIPTIKLTYEGTCGV